MGFAGVFETEEKIYFTLNFVNVLYCYSKKDASIKKLCEITEDKIISGKKLDAIIGFEDKLFIMANYSKSICVYNYRTKQKDIYEYQKSNRYNTRAIRVNREIWIIPTEVNKNIFIFNVDINKFVEETELSKKIRKLISVDIDSNIAYYPYLDGNTIYLTILNTNIIIKITLNEKIVEKIELNPKYRIRNVASKEGILWCSLYESEVIVTYDEKNEQYNEYIPSDSSKVMGSIVNVVPYNEKKLVLSTKGVYIVDDDEFMYKNIIQKDFADIDYCNIFIKGDGVYIFFFEGNEIYEYDKELRYVTTLTLNESLVNNILIDEWSHTRNEIVIESKNMIDLNMVLQHWGFVQNDVKNVYKNVGERTWQIIKE